MLSEFNTDKGTIVAGVREPEILVRIGNRYPISVAEFAGHAAVTIGKIGSGYLSDSLDNVYRTSLACAIEKSIADLEEMPRLPETSSRSGKNPFYFLAELGQVSIEDLGGVQARLPLPDFLDFTNDVIRDATAFPAVDTRLLTNAGAILKIINPEN